MLKEIGDMLKITLLLCGKCYNKKTKRLCYIYWKSNYCKTVHQSKCKRIGIKIKWKNKGLKEIGINQKNKKL